MEHIRDILSVLGLIVLPYIAWIHKNVLGVREDMSNKISREDLEHEMLDMERYVHMAQAPEKVRQAKAAEDIVRIEKKLDKVIDMLSKKP